MMRKIIFITVMCAFVAVPVKADMIQNGSFENATVNPGGSFVALGNGSTAITNWTVIGAGVKAVDYIGGYWNASDGVRSLDLNGNYGPGGIEQDISTILGNTYVVTFDMAGNPVSGGVGTIKTMNVSAIGSGTQTQPFSFDTTGHSVTNMGWTQKQWSFTADVTGVTTLQFMSTTTADNYRGPALDNVSLVPVPGAVLLGILGLGAAGIKLRKFA